MNPVLMSKHIPVLLAREMSKQGKGENIGSAEDATVVRERNRAQAAVLIFYVF